MPAQSGCQKRLSARLYPRTSGVAQLGIGRALARCGSPAGFEILISYLDDNRALLAEFAHTTLVAVTGRDYGKDARTWSGWLAEAKDSFKPYPLLERLDG